MQQFNDDMFIIYIKYNGSHYNCIYKGNVMYDLQPYTKLQNS